MKTIAATAALIAAVPLAVLGAAPAHAGADREVIRHGSCSASTDWKIKAKADDGRIEVESEVDSNRSGQTWHWVLRHDGNLVDRGRSMTAGRSGSFDVERKARNSAGADAFTFRAVNRVSGEVCVARVRF
ncbi:hypothetical protein ASC77_02240 [Nocardioides sp. Root1257]|uniref:hypothetical protein n=1 Tax=unclassified Nocardioides TaxID=2615069 RepID=UPI000701FB14|nr:MULTISPECIES: hypothetical protein [unclassified Nocardioides]KQW53139.1 hypothetical protein ASC77_02240 [Nocardioides sp. Root1257]KRC55827.1 hypothetical protein ASE24_02240 [Nocardioides sp. Root224]